MTTAPQTHTERAHAKLAPSAANRWMSCPGSAAKSAGFPNTSSAAAAEGTAAHELCAHCLENDIDPSTSIGMWIDIKGDAEHRFAELDEPPSDMENRYWEVTDEMAEAVSMYCAFVDGLRYPSDRTDSNSLEIEQWIDMRHLHPEISGTGDATVFDETAGHLHVIDFKYGKRHVVEVDDNPQLLLYATGAARRRHNMNLSGLSVHVVQPRAPHKLGPIRSSEIDLLDLFESEVKLQAAAIATDDPNAPLCAGDWCYFCPAFASCEEARKETLALAAAEFGEADEIIVTPPHDLTPEKTAKLLEGAEFVLRYVKAVQQFAHDEAMAGRTPAGFKLVAKRGIRKWKNTDDLLNWAVGAKVSVDEMFAEPKLKSPAQLESLFPGKNKEQRQAAMADLVEKKSSGVNLVPLSDPRPAVQVGAGADFEAVEDVA